MINDVEVGATLRCHDQRRFRSAQVTRAFTSVIRAASQGSQSEVSEQDELTIEPDVADINHLTTDDAATHLTVAGRR